MEIRLRKASFQTLMQRSYAQIAKVHSGEWAGRIITGCRIVSQSLIQLIPAFIGVVVQLAAAMFALHVILPQSTSVIAAALVLMALCAAALRNRLVYCHKEIVRNDAIDKVLIGLDFFDASINRIAAWVIGTRNMQKALLFALLQPNLKDAQNAGNFTDVLAYSEEAKTLPFGDVWEEYCNQCGAPVDGTWFATVKAYEEEVLVKRV